MAPAINEQNSQIIALAEKKEICIAGKKYCVHSTANLKITA